MKTLSYLPHELEKLSPEAQEEWQLLQQELTALRRDSRQLEYLFDGDYHHSGETLQLLSSSIIHLMGSKRFQEQTDSGELSKLLHDFHWRTGRIATYCKDRFAQ